MVGSCLGFEHLVEFLHFCVALHFFPFLSIDVLQATCIVVICEENIDLTSVWLRSCKGVEKWN